MRWEVSGGLTLAHSAGRQPPAQGHPGEVRLEVCVISVRDESGSDTESSGGGGEWSGLCSS